MMNAKYECVLSTIYSNPDHFISWPLRSLLLLPDVFRENYHRYPEDISRQLKSAGIPADGRSNGPAICAFLLAGGKRPQRETGRGWSIHHIYDGKFPFDGKRETTHAVKCGEYFTQAAGLVALHPIADAAADEFSDFAWWLRRQAFDRFGFDPDGVFTKEEVG
jgi:hypothetical protein